MAGHPGATVRLGLNPLASDGFDDDFDEHAPPPDGNPRIVLIPPGGTGDDALKSDFRSDDTELVRWRLVVEDLGGAAVLTLEWDAEELSGGHALYLQPIDPASESASGPAINMALATTLDVYDPGAYEIVYAAPQELAIPIVRGWNLISTPFISDQTLAALFAQHPGAVFAAWRHADGRYWRLEDGDALFAEHGYWLFWWGEATTITLRGIPADGLAVFGPGWHLIGPVGDITSAQLIQTAQPPLPANSRLWTHAPGEEAPHPLPADGNLAPGSAGWVFLPTETLLDLGMP
ncbi:MAG: hypothetical protein BWZ02_02812 [Lentisphaerae bacterium ADurb.BinA184]|nr:MAG: hypothetical protein BWZ02_02812 [Lentisphaerae bacterium ADurb.BinA184]